MAELCVSVVLNCLCILGSAVLKLPVHGHVVAGVGIGVNLLQRLLSGELFF